MESTMAAMHDYYRPHSTTLIGDEDEHAFSRHGRGGGGGEGVWGGEEGGGGWGGGGDVLKSMWTEIVDLRTQLKQLQAVNGTLTRLHRSTNKKQQQQQPPSPSPSPPPPPPPHRHHHQRSSLVTQSDDERQLETFELLSKKLSRQNLELLEYKEKINRLQKELNEKNVEHEDLFRKKSLSVQKTDIDLQLKVKERDAKVRQLEMACRKQEEVIEQLEKLLERKNSDLYERRARQMLTEENRRLKSESEKLERESQEKERRRDSLRDKFQEKKKEERMQKRIKTLEKQIADNSSRWSQEKTDMLMRLREAELELWPQQPINDKVKAKAKDYSPFLLSLDAPITSQRSRNTRDNRF